MLISSDHCSPRDPDEWRQMISDNLITRPSINYDNLFVSIRASTSFSISLTAEQKYSGRWALAQLYIYNSPLFGPQLYLCQNEVFILSLTKASIDSMWFSNYQAVSRICCVLLLRASIPLVQVDHCEQKCISGSMEKYPLNASDSWEAGGQQKSSGLNWADWLCIRWDLWNFWLCSSHFGLKMNSSNYWVQQKWNFSGF